MKYLISILVYIPGLICFLIMSIIVITVSFFFRPQWTDKLIKQLCRLLLKSFFIKIRVEEIEKLNPDKSYIFTCNHVNIFDVFILNGYIPNFSRGVELDSHFQWPIWGTVIKRYGNIPISHKNPKEALKSLEYAVEHIKSGVSIIILPEGHRTRDGKLRPFMKGPFYLAHKAKVDVVPTALVGAYEIKKVSSLVIKPGTITFKIGNIIPYSVYKDLSVTQLRDKVKEETQKLLS